MPPVIATVVRGVELRDRLDSERSRGHRIGFVPTMGSLHRGHAELIRTAAAHTDVVVVSVFVNPLQFGAGEDLDAYPRDPAGDRDVAEAAGAAVMFAPTEVEMYPHGREAVLTTVAVPRLAAVMEGASRPTHFAGVCTVVAKLWNLVGPCRAYFGEKDFQQLAILRRMAADLSFPVDVVGCPTVREPDGLALSSRNAYLSAEERAVAPVLLRALSLGAEAILSGTSDVGTVRRLMAETIDAAPLGRLDYVEVAHGDTLQPLTVATEDARLFGAVRFGRARLIDNVGVTPSSTDTDPGPRRP